MPMTFDPNNIGQPQRPEWATYVPDRSPKFKIHSNRAHALNASGYVDNYILYRNTGQQWVEVFRYEDRQRPVPGDLCECGRPYHIQGKFAIARFDWVRVGGKIIDPPQKKWFCTDCARANRST